MFLSRLMQVVSYPLSINWLQMLSTMDGGTFLSRQRQVCILRERAPRYLCALPCGLPCVCTRPCACAQCVLHLRVHALVTRLYTRAAYVIYVVPLHACMNLYCYICVCMVCRTTGDTMCACSLTLYNLLPSKVWSWLLAL